VLSVFVWAVVGVSPTPLFFCFFFFVDLYYIIIFVKSILKFKGMDERNFIDDLWRHIQYEYDQDSELNEYERRMFEQTQWLDEKRKAEEALFTICLN